MKSITEDVTVADGEETTADVITGREGVRRTIKSVWFEQNDQTNLVAYIDQERVVQVGSEVAQADYMPVPVDRELEDGQTFSVGFANSSGSSVTAKASVFFDEER